MGLFDCREVPQSVMNEQEPERELFCPVCGMETIVVGIDAVVHYENPKDLDYVIGPYEPVTGPPRSNARDPPIPNTNTNSHSHTHSDNHRSCCCDGGYHESNSTAPRYGKRTCIGSMAAGQNATG
jgi:hypothetical protein